jgi:hypothetical protein
MLALLLLFASTALAWENMFRIDTDVRYCGGPWYARSCEWRAEDSGTDCTIYAKNGNSPTESKSGPGNDVQWFHIKFNSHTSIHSDTWLWTSCSNALLIDRAYLNDQNNENGWGRQNGGAWCLSTDPNDGKGWAKKFSVSGCYRTLRFDNNDKVYYYHDQNWTPGRRALEEVPTLEAVQECENDESRDQSECEALVDLIFQFDMKHPELGELLEEDGGVSIQRAMSMAMVTPETTSVDSWAMYGLAGVGFAFLMVQGAVWFKKQTQKETFTPLKAQDEL